MDHFSLLMMKRAGAAFLFLTVGLYGHAQDSTKRKTINVTSTFKPSLKNTAKLNFNADAPTFDSSRAPLQYSVPTQYLPLSYTPVGLSPVSLPAGDSSSPWNNENYIKIGAGNIHLPYGKAGISFGNRENSYFNLFAEGYNAKGKEDFQKNSMLTAGVMGTVKTASNLEWDGKIGFRYDGYYLYGYQPQSLDFKEKDLQQQFATYEGRIGLRNTVPTEFGLTYNPNVKVIYFGDNHSDKGIEVNTVANVPIEKTLGENFAIDLGFTGDFTNYKVQGRNADNNNLFYVSPALVYHGENLSLHAEMTPSWDQKDFHLLPNFRGDYTTTDKKFTLFAVFDGFYEKGSYQRFETINPWLYQPDSLRNARVQEFYGGIKGSVGSHISYMARAGMTEYHNSPLFVNDSADAKSFRVVYEQKLNDFKVHGEITYLQGEKFSTTIGLTLNNFKTKSEYRAWGMLPTELTANLRWQIVKDLWLKGDLWAFDGGAYRNPDGTTHTANGGIDVSAGLEFRITRQFNLWLQMNNLTNDEYQRWHNYPVYGFNILGGLTYSFGRKK